MSNDLISRIEREELTIAIGLCSYNMTPEQIKDRDELIRLAKLGQQSPWIPVTPETMPVPGTKVLARLKFFASETVRHYELIRVNEDDCDWRTVDDGSEIAYEWNATHYMVIPALPEQGEGR